MPLEGEYVALDRLAVPRNAASDGDRPVVVGKSFGYQEGIVCAPENRVIVITPQPSPDGTDAPDRPDLLGVARGHERLSAGNEALHDDLRRVFQDERRLGLDGMGEEHDRRKHEDDECVDERQRRILPLAPEERRQGIVEYVPLLFNFAHGLSCAAADPTGTLTGNVRTTTDS